MSWYNLFVDGLFLFFGLENNGSGADGEERAILDDTLLAVAQYLVAYKCARVAWPVTKYVFQVTILVSTHVYYAMGNINARVVSHNGAIDTGVFHKAPDNVISHDKGNDLFVMEYVFYY